MNKQLVFGVIAVVFATALISSLVIGQASANLRDPRGNAPNNPNNNGQSISEFCNQDQSSSTTTAGATSQVQNSGNNGATCQNTNNGGNAQA